MSMVLHVNALDASLADVDNTPTPLPIGRHYPIPHGDLVGETIDKLAHYGFNVKSERHGLTPNGARYFGLLELDRGGDDYATMIGIRNSHDKRFSAGIVAGSQVFVCDNLSFCGNINLSRKHTTNILRDLPILAGRMISKLGRHFNNQAAQIDSYKQCELTEERARFLLWETIRQKAVTPSNSLRVFDEWNAPKHDEFKPRTLWSLFNAVTEVSKGIATDAVMKRTQILHRLCDSEVSLAV